MSRATITLTNGAVIVADEARWCRRRLIFRGRLRVANLSGTRYYATRDYDVPAGRVRRIRWHRDARRAAA